MSGPQCCSNRPVLNPNGGAGHVEKLGGLNTYISGSPSSKLAIILISDIYGYEAPNLRPLPVWLKDHGTDKGFEDAKLVIEALKSKGFSAIGASGFCWGGKVVVELAKSDFIQAAVILHPAFVTVEDIKEVKAPISVLGAEVDQTAPPELVKQFEEALAAKSGLDLYVKVFSKVEHGWTTRYSVEDEEAVKKAEEAHQDMLEWFSKHDKGFEEAKLVIEALKSKGFSAIGASGFCWGGRVVVELAKPDFIQAAVILHPAFVTVEDIKEVEVPISVLGAEVDHMAPPELVKQFEEALAAKSGLDFHVKVFPKVEHGWTTRYSIEDEEAVKKAEEAHQDMLEWLSKHVNAFKLRGCALCLIEERDRMANPQCCSNPPVLDANGGAGHAEKLGDLNTYFSGCPSSKLAIVLISDLFVFNTIRIGMHLVLKKSICFLHGGSIAAEYAAKNMHENIKGQLPRGSEGRIEEAVKDAYLTTYANFLEGANGGTCCVTALMQDRNLVVSNASNKNMLV
ncbi:hypothetical protein FNV43_RR01874 [Rhamnella rubrinervis]|uniref:Dienelactone hydrolase domain-containing protein n=1 Tax=Rhamnella rubrinervis TaxID=2594499 RepID=A0A8K0HQE9_9ROSA|nr:hypothetical protein FNV43_RR01874 [Rhamnella rubrinervis]